MSKTIDEIAAEHFGGVMAEMAKANGITAQLLSRWKRSGWRVEDGVIMRPHRALVDSNGDRIRDGSTKEDATPKHKT